MKKIHVYQVVYGVGIFILFAQYIWKSLFIRGVFPGAYWLFFYLDGWFIETIKFTFIFAVMVFIIWAFAKIFFGKTYPELIKIFDSLIFLGIAIIFTFPVVIAHNTVFIDQLRLKNTVYYLSAYPMFGEVNYSVAECEFTGQFCKIIFVSGDIIGTGWLNSHLEYDENSREIVLIEDVEGVIFSKLLK